jgi:hypothetical protein
MEYVLNEVNAKRRANGLNEITEDQARQALRLIEDLANAFESKAETKDV